MKEDAVGKLFTIDLHKKRNFYFYKSLENAKNFLHLHYSPLEKLKKNKKMATLLCIDEMPGNVEEEDWKIVKVLLENQTFFMYLSNINYQLNHQ